MKIKLNGKKYKILLEHNKVEDELNVELPNYAIRSFGKVYHEGKWRQCNFLIHHFPDCTKIFVSPSGLYKKGISEIGKVDKQGFVDIFEVKGYRRYLLRIQQAVYISRLSLLSLFDRAKLIKRNLLFISIAFSGASAYFLVNEFYDNYLQNLINESNFIQSLIVFLSLSSIFNIFVPFSIRKSWSIKEIDKLINLKQKREKERQERQASRKGIF